MSPTRRKHISIRWFCRTALLCSVVYLSTHSTGVEYKYLGSSKSHPRRTLAVGFATGVYQQRPADWEGQLSCSVRSLNGVDSEILVRFFATIPPNSHLDALIYYGPDFAGDLRLNPSVSAKLDEGKVNVYYTEEPPYASMLTNEQPIELRPSMMEKFDIFAGFHPGQLLSYDGHICYNGWGLVNWNVETNKPPSLDYANHWSSAWAEPLPYDARNANYDAVWVQSNCREYSHSLKSVGPSPRVSIVKALMDEISVLSLGDCLRNAKFPGGLGSTKGFGNELAKPQDNYLRQFKFAMAFENNLCNFYMSEKIWKAYALGLIPVVLGSHSLTKVLPASDSYIDVRNFETISELASHMRKISANKTLFDAFFQWRKRSLNELSVGFRDLWPSHESNEQKFKCCIARGIVKSLDSKTLHKRPSMFPGLHCDQYNFSSLIG